MFSTVDSPDARFLRIYLINDNEETPVLLPDSLKPLGREVQTIPSPEIVTELGQRLAQGRWAPYRLTDPVRQYQNAQTRTNDESLSGLAVPSPTISDDFARTLPDGQVILPKLLRMEEKGAPRIKPDEAVAFQKVRVEVWKYTLDVPSSQLKATKYLETTVDARK